MGVDLYRKDGDFHWANSGWGGVLTLAGQYGWEPTGTGPPRGTPKHHWDGSYGFSNGELFYARDAKRLADALEAALADIPRRHMPKRRKPRTLAESFAGPDRSALVDFVRFCRKGSFRIH
jgi:hypothetical protein